MDRDSTRRKGELERLLTAARLGEYPILLGTQMLAKGHHLPGVTLVGILSLDQGLHGVEFRATERMAQLLVQVAGRAGRAARAGTVLLQTRYPEHPLLLALLQQGYAGFAAQALIEREAAQLPPFSYQALLRADSRTSETAMEFLQQAATVAPALGAAELWGPAPAPLERRAARYRAQLLLQAPSRQIVQTVLNEWLPRVRDLNYPSQLRWSVDVDPQEGV
ncbi:helicase-related protein [Thiospirillum jenense]|uniref:helicase-related protein n=1 Tax=Thiospirillum jenense TaxID=1653858 RepID=UPI0030B7F671